METDLLLNWDRGDEIIESNLAANVTVTCTWILKHCSLICKMREREREKERERKELLVDVHVHVHESI